MLVLMEIFTQVHSKCQEVSAPTETTNSLKGSYNVFPKGGCKKMFIHVSFKPDVAVVDAGTPLPAQTSASVIALNQHIASARRRSVLCYSLKKKNTIKRPEVTVIEIRNPQIIIQKVKNKYMYMSYYNTFRRFERRQEFPAQASAYCYVLNEHKTGTGDSRIP